MLLDAGRRRGEHLQQACRELGLTDRVTVVVARAEAAGRDARWRASVDLVVARGSEPRPRRPSARWASSGRVAGSWCPSPRGGTPAAGIRPGLAQARTGGPGDPPRRRRDRGHVRAPRSGGGTLAPADGGPRPPTTLALTFHVERQLAGPGTFHVKRPLRGSSPFHVKRPLRGSSPFHVKPPAPMGRKRARPTLANRPGVAYRGKSQLEVETRDPAGGPGERYDARRGERRFDAPPRGADSRSAVAADRDPRRSRHSAGAAAGAGHREPEGWRGQDHDRGEPRRGARRGRLSGPHRRPRPPGQRDHRVWVSTRGT